MADKYAGKSEKWKRAKAVGMARVVLKNLHPDEYEEIYKIVLEKEFGISRDRAVVGTRKVLRRLENEMASKKTTKRWLGGQEEHYGYDK